MKTKKFTSRLVLNKKTISNLAASELKQQRGGVYTDVCTELPFPRCGYTLRDCAGTVTCAYLTYVCCSVAEC
jgi:hypothetical protein